MKPLENSDHMFLNSLLADLWLELVCNGFRASSDVMSANEVDRNDMWLRLQLVRQSVKSFINLWEKYSDVIQTKFDGYQVTNRVSCVPFHITYMAWKQMSSVWECRVHSGSRRPPSDQKRPAVWQYPRHSTKGFDCWCEAQSRVQFGNELPGKVEDIMIIMV